MKIEHLLVAFWKFPLKLFFESKRIQSQEVNNLLKEAKPELQMIAELNGFRVGTIDK